MKKLLIFNCPATVREPSGERQQLARSRLSPNEDITNLSSRTERDRENLSSSFALRRFTGENGAEFNK